MKVHFLITNIKDVEIEKLKYQMSQLMAHFENLGKIS